MYVYKEHCDGVSFLQFKTDLELASDSVLSQTLIFYVMFKTAEQPISLKEFPIYSVNAPKYL